jgi:hypothetical protein
MPVFTKRALTEPKSINFWEIRLASEKFWYVELDSHKEIINKCSLLSSAGEQRSYVLVALVCFAVFVGMSKEFSVL